MAKTALQSQKSAKVVDISDDIDLYGVFLKGTDHRVYVGSGVPKAKAEELAVWLVADAEIRIVRPAIV
jgi:hypothetical protein